MSSSLLEFGGHLFRRRLVGQQQSLVAVYPPGGNGHIAFSQATEHFDFFTSGHNPKYPSRTIDRRIRQSHPAPALVDSGEGYLFIKDLEYRIIRD
jgi:hypothetical protein